MRMAGRTAIVSFTKCAWATKWQPNILLGISYIRFHNSAKYNNKRASVLIAAVYMRYMLYRVCWVLRAGRLSVNLPRIIYVWIYYYYFYCISYRHTRLNTEKKMNLCVVGTSVPPPSSWLYNGRRSRNRFTLDELVRARTRLTAKLFRERLCNYFNGIAHNAATVPDEHDVPHKKQSKIKRKIYAFFYKSDFIVDRRHLSRMVQPPPEGAKHTHSQQMIKNVLAFCCSFFRSRMKVCSSFSIQANRETDKITRNYDHIIIIIFVRDFLWWPRRRSISCNVRFVIRQKKN